MRFVRISMHRIRPVATRRARVLWQLLGLVPAAVGAAYLFFYYEQKRRYLYDPPARPVKMQ